MSANTSKIISVIDSHTGGEPTRIIIEGGPNLGKGSMAERLEIFRKDFDDIRSAVVNEPRGSDVIVGALLCEPVNPDCVAGIIFFNNVSYLGMCGHGTIGLGVTLAYMGKIGPGKHNIETPVGPVSFTLHEDKQHVSIDNIPSYRYKANVTVQTKKYGAVSGDIAWGGNWFFLISEHGQRLSSDNTGKLTEYAWDVRNSLSEQHITGANGQLIDHVELFGPPTDPRKADSKNFVLCPGKAYDRSPCGTGTSAKLACLYAAGKLKENQLWRQESIIGSIFEGYVTVKDDKIYPHLKGNAYISAESRLILDSRDPFRAGIPLT